MDGKKSQEQSAETPSFDDLGFARSPTLKLFLQSLRSGDTEACLQMMARPEVWVIDQGSMDRYREKLGSYEAALTEVKAERDALLEGVYHLYRTFSFVFASIEENKEKESLETNSKAKFLAKTLQAIGLKGISPEAVNIMMALVDHLRRNMGTVKHNVEELGDKLQPSLDILVKHDIVKLPRPAIESTKASE